MLYHKLLVQHDTEIVFNECNDHVYQQIIKELKQDGFVCVEESQAKSGDEMYVMEKDASKLLVWKCFSHDALFLYLKNLESEYFANYLSICPKCGSSHVIQSIYYSQATKEDFERINSGELDFLSNLYDRPVVPIQNWNCKDCKFGWHNSEDIKMKR